MAGPGGISNAGQAGAGKTLATAGGGGQKGSLSVWVAHRGDEVVLASAHLAALRQGLASKSTSLQRASLPNPPLRKEHSRAVPGPGRWFRGHRQGLQPWDKVPHWVFLHFTSRLPMGECMFMSETDYPVLLPLPVNPAKHLAAGNPSPPLLYQPSLDCRFPGSPIPSTVATGRSDLRVSVPHLHTHSTQ